MGPVMHDTNKYRAFYCSTPCANPHTCPNLDTTSSDTLRGRPNATPTPTTRPNVGSPSIMTDPRFCNTQQAATQLQCSPRTIRRYIANGTITATKIGTGKTSAWLISQHQLDNLTAKDEPC